MDILLILGSVTTKQYEPLRLAMLQTGLKPKVVRVSELQSHNNFWAALTHEWYAMHGKPDMDDINADADAYIEWSEARANELQTSIRNKAFGDTSLRNVKALLYAVDATQSSDWLWLTSEIPNTVPCYQVMQSDNDDSQYLLGDGFGETFDIKK